MKKLALILFIVSLSCASAQDYSRNNANIYKHSGRTKGTFVASDSVTVSTYQQMVTFTIALDTTLATARVYVAVANDSTKYFEVRGSTGGGETLTVTGVLTKKIKIWGNAANLPIRFWVW